MVDLSKSFNYRNIFFARRPIRIPARTGPATPRTQRTRAIPCAGFRLFPVRSPLLRESLLFSFPQGTEMFHFPWFTLIPYVFRYESGHITGQRLPDSGIFGSKSGCNYPKLIAASHALHRLLAPRHPPCTLSSLTTIKDYRLFWQDTFTLCSCQRTLPASLTFKRKPNSLAIKSSYI